MKLDNWVIIGTGHCPYTPPELRSFTLQGDVTGNPSFKDGTFIQVTSPEFIKDGKLHTRSGSIYELGHPRSDYEAAFPGARERLVQQLQVML